MYSTQAACAEAGSWQTIRAFNRSVSRSQTALYEFYLAEVLADDALFPSRNINDLVSYAWLNALVP
jgi:hypothetical protein